MQILGRGVAGGCTVFDPNVEIPSSSTPLCEIMQRYRSDKGNVSDTARHNYTRFYHVLFSPMRNRVTRVFELGIFQGASLRAWRDYFPRACVFGADINPQCKIQEDRIFTATCDETDAVQVRTMWATWCETFDVMIDDGLHTFADNLAFFEKSNRELCSGGVYVVEDLLREELPLFHQFADSKRAEGWMARLVLMPREVFGEDVPDNNLLVLVKP